MPDKFIVSNLSASSSDLSTSSSIAPVISEPKVLTIRIGSQEVPLSSLILAVGALLIFFIIWHSIMAFSASLVRLAVGLVIAGAMFLFSPLQNQLLGSATPGSASHQSPRVDDGTADVLN